MMALLISSLLLGLLIFPMVGHAEKIKTVQKNDEKNKAITYSFYDASEHGHTSSRSSILSPTFYIYAGNITAEQADELIAQLEMEQVVEEWAAQIYVVNPLDKKEYTQEDSKAFLQLLASTHGVPNGVSNIKIIGIDQGATFVNEELADLMYPVAGVMTIGGTVGEDSAIHSPVPAYVSNSSDQVAELYTQANESELVEEEKEFKYYANSKAELQQVIVSQKEETLAEAFSNAWNKVLSKNYRMHNKTTEFYMADVTQITSDYDLEPVIDFEALDVTYNQMEKEPIEGKGEYTWYEYIPAKIKEKDSIPLVVTLHGFGNDPRIQGDTSGWVELAASEGLIVVSPEWQDKADNFSGNDGLGEAGILSLIDMLKEKYPQIDPSQVYITGLSAGGSKAALWGAKYSEIFAAAASISSPGVDKEELTAISEKYSGGQVPYLYICGDHDFFQMIPVDGSSPNGMPNIFFDDPNVSMFEFIQAYQRINQLEISEEPDLALNPYYGVKMTNQKETKLGNKDILSGTLTTDDDQTLIELVAIKDLAHWNYRPEAAFVWAFFQQYKRNTTDGSLEFNDSPTGNVASTADKSESKFINIVLVIVVVIAVIAGAVIYKYKKK
ncbi:alpha/beta hydrolase family esterase [Candidatus Enterococcus clewellii]|nr:PHB depolymerase family esterase [Enterococcus sp. 9E7_DIV0242]